MATTPTEPKSVSAILKQRQQSRSAGVAPKSGSKGPGPGGSNVNENLNPVLPPLYPSAPKSIPVNPESFRTVKVYNRFSQYFRSNFSVAPDSKGEDAFYLTRYTDQYKSPLTLKPHLLYKLPDSKFPPDLIKKAAVKSKPVFTRRKRRRLESLSDDEGREGSPRKSVDNADEEVEEEEKEENPNVEDNDELEDEFDEEMDMGTDYVNSYFDNGEGDDDDRDDDDGPTY